MKYLVLNSGSSSVKFQVFGHEGDALKALVRGMVERVGLSAPTFTYRLIDDSGEREESKEENAAAADHEAAIGLICGLLTNPENGILEDLSELAGVGHRVVHGGERFTESVRITDEVIEGIEACAKLAPLHNPPALMGIRACERVFEGLPQVAVFDTAFHHTIPPKAFLYGIPMELYTKYGIRKYGFHGISHQYVAHEAARRLERRLEELRLITCHLGNGCSVTAVEGGQSVDTSMGLTPMGGVMMGSRCGDIDPYIPLFMINELGMTPAEVEKTLNKESGLWGICHFTDMRDVIDHMLQGDEECELALDMFALRIARYIGSYATVMNGVDAIVFTGGIGERDPAMRARVLSTTGYLGAELDYRRNAKNATVISQKNTPVTVLVIPTNEELVIARETLNVLAADAVTAQPS